MPKFRKKPVVIEAEQFLWTQDHPCFPETKPSRIPKGVVRKKFTDYQDTKPYYKYGIETLGGFIECKDKDWIITGVKGEKYPCKDEIFRETYQQVNGIGQGVEIE